MRSKRPLTASTSTRRLVPGLPLSQTVISASACQVLLAKYAHLLEKERNYSILSVFEDNVYEIIVIAHTSKKSSIYIIGKTLGKGGCGAVKLAQNLVTGDLCSVKVIKPKSERALRVLPEKETLEVLNRLVDYVAFYDEEHPYALEYLFMPYYHGPSLFRHVYEIDKTLPIDDIGYCRSKKSLPMDEVIKLAFELAKAIKELHNKNRAHFDLNLSNVILTDAMDAKLVVIDFGASSHIKKWQDNGLVGTYGYIPPDKQSEADPLLKAIDIFALGVMFSEMATSHNYQLTLRNILKNNAESTPDITLDDLREAMPDVLTTDALSHVESKSKTKEFYELIQAMLSEDPNDRPTIQQVFQKLERLAYGQFIKRVSSLLIHNLFDGVSSGGSTSPRGITPPSSPSVLRGRRHTHTHADNSVHLIASVTQSDKIHDVDRIQREDEALSDGVYPDTPRPK